MSIKEDVRFLKGLAETYRSIREGFPSMDNVAILDVGCFFDGFKGDLMDTGDYITFCTELWLKENKWCVCVTGRIALKELPGRTGDGLLCANSEINTDTELCVTKSEHAW